MLLNTPFAHIAVATEHLQAGAGTAESLLGPGRFQHRRDQGTPAVGAGAAIGVGVVLEHVELHRGLVRQHPPGVDPGALRVQDAAHGGVPGNRVGFARDGLAAGHAHLAALPSIGVGFLPGGFQQADALQTHVQARGVHHHKHRVEAFARLADDPTGRVVKTQHAGRAAVQAHFFFNPFTDDGVATARLVKF